MVESQSLELANVSRVLSGGSTAILNAQGERVELPASVQEVMRAVVGMMQAGQVVTLFPALTHEDLDRLHTLDEMAREAYALGLYDREPAGSAE